MRRNLSSDLRMLGLALLWLVASLAVMAQDSSGPRNFDRLAARGASIAAAEPAATELKNQQPDDAARRGFDIGLAVAEKDTLPGPGKQAIHDALPADQQDGYAAAVAFSLERNQRLARENAPVAGAARPIGKFNDVAINKHSSITELLRQPAPMLGDVQVSPGWHLVISFTSTQKSRPLVEVGTAIPVRDGKGILAFPVGSGAVARFVAPDNGRYYSDFDVVREGFQPGATYHYIVNVFGDDPARGREQSSGRFTMASGANPAFVCDVHSVLGLDGSTSECSPYLCESGRCLMTCSSVDDCAEPFLCDTNGRCVAPPN